jgi:hypothetical protein
LLPNAATLCAAAFVFAIALAQPVPAAEPNVATNGPARSVEARAAAGPTNAVQTLSSQPTAGPLLPLLVPMVAVSLLLDAQHMLMPQEPARPSLVGKPLPGLAAAGLDGKAPAGKPILLCLFDLGQRPSRRCLRLLGEQYDRLAQRGITVLGLQTSPTEDAAWKEWLGANPVPFPLGRLPEKAETLDWAAGMDSLPWLILTDAKGKVTAEGFPLEDLDARLKDLKD